MRGFGRNRSERELAASARGCGAGVPVLDLSTYRKSFVGCAANRCGVRVNEGQIFCRDHWLSLPRELRTSIGTTFRHRLAKDYGALVQRAIALIDERRVA